MSRSRSRQRAGTLTQRVPDAVMERTRAASCRWTRCQRWITAGAVDPWQGSSGGGARVSSRDWRSTNQMAISSSSEQAASSQSMDPNRADSDPPLAIPEMTGEEGVGAERGEANWKWSGLRQMARVWSR